MKNIFHGAISTLVFSISINVSASENCAGKISDVHISRSGDVSITGEWNNALSKICNLNSDWNSVSPDTCKGWLSVSQTAFVAGREIIARIPVTSCSDTPTYSPEYIKLR